MNYYRIVATFAESRTQSDIATRRESADAAREYARERFSEIEKPPIAITARRISKAVAEDIIDGGGIDWT